MKTATSLLALALTAWGPAALAADYTVSRSAEITASPEEAWQVIGDFCDIDDWHPAITGCALKSIDGSVHRILTLDGGGEVVEKLVAVDQGGLSYTYSIVSAPMPITGYTSTVSITRGDPSTVNWSGRFKSDDPTMEAAFTGLYEAGLGAIAARFSE